MNEACVNTCAPKRDTSYFQLKDGLNLEDLPHFPQRQWQEEMTGSERQAIAGIYLKAFDNHLRGIRNEPTRTYPDSIRNRRILEAVQKQSVPDGAEERDTSRQNGQVREDKDS